MSENIDDIVKDFVIDSYENLDRVDRELVALEQDPNALDIITRIFRCIHTIKGVCGFLSYSKLREVCHAGESLLSCLRDSRLRFNPEIASALMTMVDAIRQILGCIESNRTEGDVEYSVLTENLLRLVGQAEPAKPRPGKSPPKEHVPQTAAPALTPAAAAPQETVEASETPVVAASAPSVPAGPVPPRHDGHGGGSGGESFEPRSSGVPGATWDRGIRVDIDLLDKLMTLVGELVLARNQILQYTAGQGNQLLASAAQRLDTITTELQEGVMKTRMQPIGTIWSRFPRLVRDLAVACGKEVRVEMEGMETELDKTLIEAIKDPLTHLVRNSVDHGIEFPGARVARGKPREGHMTLSAFHEGGFVNIEIADDGNGVDFDKVRAKAVQAGLVTSEQAVRLSYKEVINLLFLPGFSTADRITDISGRGVGMDVVKTNIERIGGTIDIETTPGQGTKMVVKVPLTLAIIPALMVVCDGDRYAIPQSSLIELVRLDGQSREHIEYLHGTPVYRLRNRLLPLVNLKKQLALDSNASLENALLNIVVLHASGRHFGLIVDSVRDTEEIVVKPLGKQLQGIGCYAGATILGDGKVALILEVLGLAQEANVISKLEDRQEAADEARREQLSHLQSVLLFAGRSGQMAVALDKVARLEAFPRHVVESAGGQDVVQYRGEIMRLVHLSNALPGYEPDESQSDLLHALVYTHGARSMGLVIGSIMDIVEAPLKLQQTGIRPGVMGSGVIGGHITEFLDIEDIVRSTDPSVLEGQAAYG